MLTVQYYPTADSMPTDPFEALVTLHFQLKGYITSSNKWFWVRDDEKKQRGYQDIDVLAINESETVIVSVTTNLDDKVRHTIDGTLRADMLNGLVAHFERAQAYLRSVQQYAWLLRRERTIRTVVAFISGEKQAKRICDTLGKHGIELLSAQQVIQHLLQVIPEQENNGLRTNNQLMKTVQLIAGQIRFLEADDTV